MQRRLCEDASIDVRTSSRHFQTAHGGYLRPSPCLPGSGFFFSGELQGSACRAPMVPGHACANLFESLTYHSIQMAIIAPEMDDLPILQIWFPIGLRRSCHKYSHPTFTVSLRTVSWHGQEPPGKIRGETFSRWPQAAHDPTNSNICEVK